MTLPTSARFPALVALLALVAAPASAHVAYQVIRDLNGDGRIDNLDIQAAVDDMEGPRQFYTPGVLFLPAETYVFTAPVVIRRSGIHIVGEGRREPRTLRSATQIDVRASDATAFIIDGTHPSSDGCHDNSIRDLSIFGRVEHVNVGFNNPDPFNNLQRTGAGGLPVSPAIRLLGTHHTLLENIRIERTGRGVDVVDCQFPVLSNMNIVNAADDYLFRFFGSDGKVCAYPTLSYIIAGENTSVIEPTVVAVLVEGNVFGLQAHTVKVTGGSRLLVTRQGDHPDHVPELVYASKFGVDNCEFDAMHLEQGSLVLMNNLLIIGNTQGTGLRASPGFKGELLVANLNIRGCGYHAMSLEGGRDYAFVNAFSGASGIREANIYAGIAVAAAVENLRVLGGRVAPPPQMGSVSKQRYGIYFPGTLEQARSANLMFFGTDTLDIDSAPNYTTPEHPVGITKIDPL